MSEEEDYLCCTSTYSVDFKNKTNNKEEEEEEEEDEEEGEEKEEEKMTKCNGCNKTMLLKSLVRHLSQTRQPCKSAYGQDFIDDWKKRTAMESKKQYKRQNRQLISQQNAQYYKENTEKINKRCQKRKAEEIKRWERDSEEERLKRMKEWKEDEEKDARHSNNNNKKEAMWYLERGLERLKYSDDSKVTEFQIILDEIHSKMDKEINLVAQKAAEYSGWPRDVTKLYDEVSNCCKWHDVYIQMDIFLKKIAEKQGQEHRCEIPPVFFKISNGNLKCHLHCEMVYDPQADSFYSFERGELPSAMPIKGGEEKGFPRKQKSMNTSVADLEENMDEVDDEFKDDVEPSIIKRNVPRHCEKDIILEDLEYLEESESESHDTSDQENSEESEPD